MDVYFSAGRAIRAHAGGTDMSIAHEIRRMGVDVKWIASTNDPFDAGEPGTPAFPYSLYRPISKRCDVQAALGSDLKEIETGLAAAGFESLVRTLWEINQFPRLFTTHTVTAIDQGKTLPDCFDWATHRCSCRICILPRDMEVPDLETARLIVNEVHGALLDVLRARRLTPPKGTLIFCHPILMKFGTRAQGFPMMGFAVRMLVDGYANKATEAGIRCGRALALVSELLAEARS